MLVYSVGREWKSYQQRNLKGNNKYAFYDLLSRGDDDDDDDRFEIASLLTNRFIIR